MKNDNQSNQRFPLLEQLLRDGGIPMKPAYKTRDLARLFDVKPRTIQEWIRDGRIKSVRDLPGHNRLLPQDIEEFLRDSHCKNDDTGQGGTTKTTACSGSAGNGEGVLPVR